MKNHTCNSIFVDTIKTDYGSRENYSKLTNDDIMNNLICFF